MAEGLDQTEDKDQREREAQAEAAGPAPVVEATGEDETEDEAVETDGVHVETETRIRKRPLYKRPAFLIIAAIVLIVAAIFVIRYWLYARSHESTDDAFIDGHIIQLSPKVSGYVTKVYVTDNQEVKKGDLLIEIDPRDYEARLEQAQATLDAGLARLREAR